MQKQDIDPRLSWESLLKRAVTEPGIVTNAYRMFHRYSPGNQLLALIQCEIRGIEPGPINTYKGWQELGRQVQRGQKAIELWMPVTGKRKEENEETGEEVEHKFTRFILRRNWFVLSQTEGEDYAHDIPTPEWDKDKALAELGIEETAFDMPDGNVQGYADGRQIAVSPIAAMPYKTRFHELGHVVLGHTSRGEMSDAPDMPRNIREVEAESVAYLCCQTLGLPGAEESRGYIQSWLDNEEISEDNARRIFSAANKILKAGEPGDDTPEPPRPRKAEPKAEPQPKPSRKNQGGKLRNLADKMGPTIEDKMADRLTNTPRRLAQAEHSRREGERLQRTQSALYALADLHDAGQVPNILRDFTTKKAVYDLMGTKTEQVPNGWHSYSVCTGEPYYDTPEAVALWELLKDKSDEDKRADKLRRMVQDVQFAKIPGYFPTPKAVVQTLLRYADVRPGHVCLEPSAGSGDLADAIVDQVERVDTVERNHTLAEILKAKGYPVTQGDFMETTPQGEYDRVLMNPPFERLQDIDHVRHAYRHLKPGGTLVSVMSPGPFFRNDRKASEFRDWFEDLGGEVHQLPDLSFKDSGTSVAACFVVLNRD